MAVFELHHRALAECLQEFVDIIPPALLWLAWKGVILFVSLSEKLPRARRRPGMQAKGVKILELVAAVPLVLPSWALI